MNPLPEIRPPADGRERILAAALDEFAARGFDGASTTVIARRSGVTQPLIHYHFRSKEGLWRATVNHLFRELGREFLETIRAHPPGVGDARTAFLAIIREFVRFCGRHPQFPRLLYLELPIQSPRSAWLMETWVKPVVTHVAELHRAHASESRLRDISVGHFIAAISGAAATPFALGRFMADAWQVDPADDAMIENHADLLVGLLEHGVFATTP